MATDDPIEQAVTILHRGGVVAIPTETVYGLAADARNAQAVRRVFSIKGRPANHPLIVHLHRIEQLSDWAVDIPTAAIRVAQQFWPGPLTLILPRAAHVIAEVTAGQSTVGLRIPRHPMALEILRRFGDGLAAPSANRFTRVSPTTVAHVRLDLGESVDYIVDGGQSEVGIESTIVDFSQDPPAILRLGGLTVEDLEKAAEISFSRLNREATVSPGQHHLHYAPQLQTLIVDSEQLAATAMERARCGQKVVVISQLPRPVDLDSLNSFDGSQAAISWWQLPSDLNEVAYVLYDWLHRVDEQPFDILLVDLPPAEGLGAAIRDKLRRAAGQG